MQDLYKAIDALNEITQQERDAMRAAAKADVAAVRQATTGKAPPPTKADMYKDVADFAKQQRAQSKADGYATRDEYNAAYQKNLDALSAAGVDMEKISATANQMMKTEKGAARLAKMGIKDDDDLLSYAMMKAGIKDMTPDKYTATDFAITDIPEGEELDERVTYNTLAKLSGIKDPNKIYPGQKITLPGGGSYTVKSGDTLSGIAQDFRLKKIGQPKSGKLDDPTTKLPQVPKKSGKLDDPTTKLPQVPTIEPGDEPGDFNISTNKKDAGDDTDDMLNKYAFLRGRDYKLDPKSVKQPPKKERGKSLFKQIGDFVKGTKAYNIATTNPEPTKIPATVQGREVDLANPKTAGVDLGNYGDTSKMSVMDLARKMDADPKLAARSDAQKQADIGKQVAFNDAQRAEIMKRLKNQRNQ
jgi:LysM repeat protein